MTHEDEIAAKAARASTLKSLKIKKELRIKQLKQETAAKIREINIQYAEDPERLRAKYAADDYAKSEKARIAAERKIKKEKARIEKEAGLRPYTLGEEIFSSVVQGIGAALFIAATALLNVIAIGKVPAEYGPNFVYHILFTLFGAITIFNYITSVLHHALTPSGAKEVFSRLCRIAIYMIIASAFTTYAYTAAKAHVINSAIGAAPLFCMIMCFVVWAICLTGILMTAIGGSKLEVVNIIFYAILGWSGLYIFAQLYHVITKPSFSLLLTSGLVYTLGLVLTNLRKVKYMHSIGNMVILFASVCMFFSFFFMF